MPAQNLDKIYRTLSVRGYLMQQCDRGLKGARERCQHDDAAAARDSALRHRTIDPHHDDTVRDGGCFRYATDS